MFCLHPTGAQPFRGVFCKLLALASYRRQKSELTAQDSWQLGGHIWSGCPGNKLSLQVPLPCEQSCVPLSALTCRLSGCLFLGSVAADKGER